MSNSELYHQLILQLAISFGTMTDNDLIENERSLISITFVAFVIGLYFHFKLFCPIISLFQVWHPKRCGQNVHQVRPWVPTFPDYHCSKEYMKFQLQSGTV